MPPKNNNFGFDGWLISWDKVRSGENSPRYDFNVTPQPQTGIVVPIPLIAVPAAALAAGSYMATHPNEIAEGIRAIPGAVSEIGDYVSSAWNNMMRPRTRETRPLNSSAIYARPVEVPDATRMNLKLGPLEINVRRHKEASPTVSSESTTSNPASSNDSVPKPSNKKPEEDKSLNEQSEPTPNTQNPKDSNNKKPFWQSKKGKAVKWVIGELTAVPFFEAIGNIESADTVPSSWNWSRNLTPIGWLTLIGKLKNKEHIANMKKQPTNTTTVKSSTPEVETPKQEPKDSVQLSKEDQDLLNQILGQ